MCRSIQPLHNYEPPTTADEVTAAALQYVRKISGTTRPARVNQAAFDAAVAEVAAATERLLSSLVATSSPHTRALERERARARWEPRRASARVPAGARLGPDQDNREGLTAALGAAPRTGANNQCGFSVCKGCPSVIGCIASWHRWLTAPAHSQDGGPGAPQGAHCCWFP